MKKLLSALLVFMIISRASAQVIIPISPVKSELFQTIKYTSESVTGQIKPAENFLKWDAPIESPGKVGQFEKLEIGVVLDSLISNQLLNHVFRREGDKINPFNPEEIDVFAEFWVLDKGVWYGPVRVNGFYFQDYSRTEKGWALNALDDLFRIRFAPEYIGLWRCKVSAKVKEELIYFEEFTFETVSSQNKGFVRVGDNKRFLREGEDPFYPIGQN